MMANANPLTVVGLMLTLSGLVGTYFYIHLSMWMRDVSALLQKTRLNNLEGTEAERRAIIECRIELRRLSTWPTYVVNVAVIAFVTFALVLGLDMIQVAAADPLQPKVQLALTVFLLLFLALSAALMIIGVADVRSIGKALPARVPRST